MDEKEIEETLSQCVDWEKDCLDPCFTVSNAAHAIAERLREDDEKGLEEATWRIEKLLKEAEEREGVVWEDEGTVARTHGTWDFNTSRTSLTIFGSAEVKDGQRVRVTVTAEKALQTESKAPEADKE